jgi:glycosyltransferase involved in cell wall biosynthesis
MTAGLNGSGPRQRRVCVVGAGMHFISGLSYYTYFLSRGLAEANDVSVILMRALVPKLLYPGRDRVGSKITGLSTSTFAPTFNGIDWTLVPSLVRALDFLHEQHPDVLVLEWWSASCLPSYLALCRAAHKMGIPVVLELHEDMHESEAKIPLAGPLAANLLRRLIDVADAYVVHSPSHLDRILVNYGLDPSDTLVVPVGPFDLAGRADVRARGPEDRATILYFGTVRPYKGLEYLVDAFDELCVQEPEKWQLLVVGEPWEGWRLPFDKIAASAHRNSIEVIARYVHDEEIPEIFSRADVVALPYLESCASGPLHLTMAAGLPVVVTQVGGLAFAVDGYLGATLVPAANSAALAEGIRSMEPMFPNRFEDPHSWKHTRDAFDGLFGRLLSEKVSSSESESESDRTRARF